MKKNWYNILPIIALISGILFVLSVLAAIIFKPQANFENATNRKIAFGKLKQISIERKEMLSGKAFFDYAEKMVKCDVINTIWIISEKGEIVYVHGLMAPGTKLHESVYDRIDDQNRGLINAVKGSVDSLQLSLISIAAAIRSEGEHNDVIGHLVVPIKTSGNELAGFIGVAYSLNDSEHSGATFILLGTVLFISFLIYWLSIPLWVYYDSRKRNDKYILWTMFVLIGNLPAYIAYLISRK